MPSDWSGRTRCLQRALKSNTLPKWEVIRGCGALRTAHPAHLSGYLAEYVSPLTGMPCTCA